MSMAELEVAVIGKMLLAVAWLGSGASGGGGTALYMAMVGVDDIGDSLHTRWRWAVERCCGVWYFEDNRIFVGLQLD